MSLCVRAHSDVLMHGDASKVQPALKLFISALVTGELVFNNLIIKEHIRHTC